MSLYFIRHGESLANKEGFFAGQLDIPMTPEGFAQARSAGEELLRSGMVFDEIISSPLRRAYDTAMVIAGILNYPLERISRNVKLMERNMGSLQGESVRSSNVLEMLDEVGQKAAGIETEAMLLARAEELLREIEPISNKNVLLVSHNGFGRRLLCAIHGVDLSQTKKFPNAQTVILTDISLLERQ